MDDQKIAQNLKTIFEKVLDNFPINKSMHYAERLFRITGEEKYIKYIHKYYKDKYPEFIEYIESYNNSAKMSLMGNRFIDKAAEQKNAKRMLDRIPIYKEIPEFKYYQELVWYFNKFNDFSLEEVLNKLDVKNVFEQLSQIDWNRYIFNERLVKVDPVQTVNTVFHLKNLNIIDYTDKYIDMCQNLFSNFTNDDEFMNLLYFYTHVLISDSSYYQTHINIAKYEYMYDFFDNSIDRIVQTDNNDIICEIGVCYKLARYSGVTLNKIMENIKTYFVNENVVLTKKNEVADFEHLEKVEHRNVLAIMLFSNMNKLYKGPRFKL